MYNANIRNGNDEVSNELSAKLADISRRHPDVLYNGGIGADEDAADYYPRGLTLKGTVLA